MRFSVPPRLLLGRWALTPPFHPCRAIPKEKPGGLSFCGTVCRPAFQPAARVYSKLKPGLRGILPCGVRTFLLQLRALEAILRSSETDASYSRWNLMQSLSE